MSHENYFNLIVLTSKLIDNNTFRVGAEVNVELHVPGRLTGARQDI
jgi:hypothetical protein